MTDPAWLEPGADVIECPSGNYLVAVTRAKVDRILKRAVVLDNGNRYSRDHLDRSQGGTYGTRYTLHSASDPVAVRAYKDQRQRRIRTNATRRLTAVSPDWIATGDNVYLDAMEATLRAARQAIVDIEDE